jgi:NAD(P)-dependent dehydrogenase (short-subunit alcohol dehydrogenase family)
MSPSHASSALGDSSIPFDLTGRVALITGSTRGIGAAIAAEFAGAGAEVIITGRDIDEAQNVATDLVSRGGTAHAIAYEAGAEGAPQALINAVSTHTNRLDILVNNAAILRPHRIGKLSEDEFDEVFRINTRAALFLCQAAHTLLIRSEAASIVNVTAACAHRPMAGLGAYCASKAAMINFTSTLAQEWAKDGIRVNALTPGSVATDMILPKDPIKRAAFEENMAEQNLLGRLAEPREIAHAVRFLASSAASFMTGQTLIVDGGFLA